MNKTEFSEKISEFEKELKNNYPLIKYSTNASLKAHTTFKIGGPADILINATTKEELLSILRLAKEFVLPYTMLGWGSNILVSDKGIRGIVIKNQAKSIKIEGMQNNKHETQKDKRSKIIDLPARLDEVEPKKYYSFEDLDYSESDAENINVEAESGTPLPITIITLIRQGITGLQWFGGIPGTIGGAVYNNIHGGSHFLSEYIESVAIYNPETNSEKIFQAAECNFGYDSSRFHKSGEIILSVKFRLKKGNARKAEFVYKEWTRRKKVQPQKSAGCVWKNLSEEERNRLNLESGSWGYIIDKILGLKGRQIGGAKISENHAAFIENIKDAKAQDVLDLMSLIKKKSKEKLGIIPESEIFVIGER